MTSSADINGLIRRAQEGDVAAFQKVISSHLGQARRFARGFSSNEQDADDLAQEALVKAYRSLRSYRFRSSFSTWLFRITRNVCIDAARSRAAKEKARQASLRASRACDELAVQPDAQLAREQDRQRLWNALNRLPGEFRSVILLFYVEGMSHDEIAAIERIAVGTVKSRLSRGRRRLRELLRPAASTRPPAGNLSGPSLVKPEGSP